MEKLVDSNCFFEEDDFLEKDRECSMLLTDFVALELDRKAKSPSQSVVHLVERVLFSMEKTPEQNAVHCKA
jgi:hypothetical protein